MLEALLEEIQLLPIEDLADFDNQLTNAYNWAKTLFESKCNGDCSEKCA
jgi:hypothetical protein